MKRNFELMLILDKDITDVKRASLLESVQKMIGSGVRTEKLGLRRFSVPINYKSEGYYTLLHFQASPEKIAEMTKVMNITDGIVRFMFVSKTEKEIEADKIRKAQRDKIKAERELAEKTAAVAAAEEKKEKKVKSEKEKEKKENKGETSE